MILHKRWLQEILKGIGVICVCSFLSIAPADAQQKNTTGIVVDDENGDPLIGASIIVKGTQLGCISDMNGRFTFNQRLPEKQILIVSYI